MASDFNHDRAEAMTLPGLKPADLRQILAQVKQGESVGAFWPVDVNIAAEVLPSFQLRFCRVFTLINRGF